MRVLFAGGGTGGHLYPALAIAEHLRSRQQDFEALFLGSARGIEASAVPRAGFELHCIQGSGFRRSGLLSRLKAMFSLLLGLWSALRVVHRFRPHVVVATGGWASLAGGLAAVLLRRPLLVQEQNSVPGFSNRLLGRWAAQVHIAFPGTEAAFAHPERVHLSGNPLRESLLIEASEPTVVSETSPWTILVVGGSRGARSINAAVSEAVPLLQASLPLHWLWQTGELDHAALVSQWGAHASVTLCAFLEDIAAAYRSCRLLVCRAGAMTLAEITALGKPAILVPYPGAVDDHQTRNARVLVDAGAAVLLPDADLSGARLAAEITRLLHEPGRLQEMSRQSRALARPAATAQLAAAIGQMSGASQGNMALVSS